MFKKANKKLQYSGIGLSVLALLFFSFTVQATDWTNWDQQDAGFHKYQHAMSDPARATIEATDGYDLANAADGSIIHIPFGVTAHVTSVQVNRIRDIIVDGVLMINALDADTSLLVETIWVRALGELKVESLSGNVAKIVFTDDYGFNTDAPSLSSYDPALVSRGIISVGGKIRIDGLEKTTLARAISVSAGETSLNLDAGPFNWNPGDEIVVGAVGKNNGDSEIVIIESISGNTVSLTTALQNDHVLPAHSSDAELFVPIGNLTRSVVIQSEQAEPVNSRGHIMIMNDHDAMLDHDTEVNYAQLVDLGRTVKFIQLNDTKFDADANATIIGSNNRARYPIHFHRAGPGSMPGKVHGSSVVRSPGWGFVNHNSNAEFTDNVAYGVQGASFTTEASNETGTFIRNASFHTITPRVFKNHNDFRGRSNFGHMGDGFWLQGLNVDVVDNIVSGFSGSAYAFFGVSIDHPDAGKAGDGSVKNYVEKAYMDPPGSGFIQANRNRIRLFDNNTAYAGRSALFVWSSSPDRRHKGVQFSNYRNLLAVNVKRGVDSRYAHGNNIDSPIFINNATDGDYGTTAFFPKRANILLTASGPIHAEGFASTPEPLVPDDTPPTSIILRADAINIGAARIPVNIDVLANDIGDGLRVTSVSATKKGKGEATLEADGTVTYSPIKGKKNKDSFTYTATDSSGESAHAVVNVQLPTKKNPNPGGK